MYFPLLELSIRAFLWILGLGYRIRLTTVAYKVGASAYTANATFHGYLYYDKNKGTAEFSQQASLGLGPGVLEGINITIPLRRYYDFISNL
jgi:hypothetical protein